eukprot:9372772-Karenia_brevis.AAC.1
MSFVKFLFPPHLHSLFHTSFSGANRLLTYGFSNRLPHTSLFLHLPDHIISSLDYTLLHTTHALTLAQQKDYKDDTLTVKTKKVSGHFVPKWSAQLQRLHDEASRL